MLCRLLCLRLAAGLLVQFFMDFVRVTELSLASRLALLLCLLHLLAVTAQAGRCAAASAPSQARGPCTAHCVRTSCS